MCEKFVNKSNFSPISKKIHNANSNETPNFTIISFEYFKNYEYLRKHLTTIHNVELECSEFNFKSISGTVLIYSRFYISVAYIYSIFHHFTNGKIKSSNVVYHFMFFGTHINYSLMAVKKNIVTAIAQIITFQRASKSKGTNQIGKACPSRMYVLTKSSDSSVLVKLWKTRVGHSIDIGRVVVSKETITKIAGVYSHFIMKIKNTISFKFQVN